MRQVTDSAGIASPKGRAEVGEPRQTFALLRTAAAGSGVPIALAACILLAVACTPNDAPKAAASLPPMTVHDTMAWVIDPAADVIWGSAGFVLTEAGTQDLAPTTDAGWDKVRHSATVVAASGELLLLPNALLPEPSEQPAWVEFTAGMTRIAGEAIAAVEARDAEALFEVGGHLYNVCLACHQVYARPEDSMVAEPPASPGP